MATLSDRLQQLKTDKCLLQKDIAHNTGIALRSYQYYENGTREPSSSALIKLAEYFNVSIDYLVGRTDNPKVNE